MSEAELKSVYRECVLNHSREPHNFGRAPAVNREAVGFNPLCGDKITVYMNVQDDTLETVTFEGTGCAICIASASMMTDVLRGATAASADSLIDAAHDMFTDANPTEHPQLQEFQALTSVRAYPSRIKCATLGWSAAKAALEASNHKQEQVTTE